jgi:hypothetical protein
MRKKLLQNTLFVAMAAWAMYLAQGQASVQSAQLLGGVTAVAVR